MSLASKYLKLVQTGYETYTGPIGASEFINGISTVMIPRVDRDRLATAFQFVEFTEEGVDEIPAGVAHRLVADSAIRAADQKPLERQTEAEKEIEMAMSKIAREDERVIYTREELEKIADKKGINGLREVAKPWDVKHRATAELIALILQAQDNWLALRQAEFERRGLTREQFEASLVPQPAETPAPAADAPAETEEAPVAETAETPEADDPAPSPEQAAETGDLAAALNQE